MTWPSPERLAVAWAKANPALDQELSGAVATALPDMPPWVSPFMTVGLVAGAPMVGEAPLDRPLLQWDTWASSGERPGPDWTAADRASRVLIRELFDATPVRVGDEGWVYGFEIISQRRAFDSDRPFARFTIDAFMTCREVEVVEVVPT